LRACWHCFLVRNPPLLYCRRCPSLDQGRRSTRCRYCHACGRSPASGLLLDREAEQVQQPASRHQSPTAKRDGRKLTPCRGAVGRAPAHAEELRCMLDGNCRRELRYVGENDSSRRVRFRWRRRRLPAGARRLSHSSFLPTQAVRTGCSQRPPRGIGNQDCRHPGGPLCRGHSPAERKAARRDVRRYPHDRSPGRRPTQERGPGPQRTWPRRVRPPAAHRAPPGP
jgi:hypothetical protein